MKMLSEEMQHQGQAIVYTRLVRANSNRLRIVIKSDSYDAQSHAFIDRWDGNQWQRIHTITNAVNMKTPISLAYAAEVSYRIFDDDADRLIAFARQVLNLTA